MGNKRTADINLSATIIGDHISLTGRSEGDGELIMNALCQVLAKTCHEMDESIFICLKAVYQYYRELKKEKKQ